MIFWPLRELKGVTDRAPHLHVTDRAPHLHEWLQGCLPRANPFPNHPSDKSPLKVLRHSFPHALISPSRSTAAPDAGCSILQRPLVRVSDDLFQTSEAPSHDLKDLFTPMQGRCTGGTTPCCARCSLSVRFLFPPQPLTPPFHSVRVVLHGVVSPELRIAP